MHVRISESNRQILFVVNKIMHIFKIRFKYVKTFLIQTYKLAVFKGERSKVILFSKINLFLRSATQGSIRRDLIKKTVS